ncbi:MAG: hypothetical protein GX800_06755 [Clostridiaceae bacterium]|nr:hypothetical protein [Clostridiaceae bacterium]
MCKIFNKIVTLAVAVCVLISISVFNVSAAVPGEIKISDVQVSAGRSTSLDVSVRGIPTTSKGVSFGVSFDKNILGITSVEKSGVIENSAADIDAENGSLGFAGIFYVDEVASFDDWVVVARINVAVKREATLGDSILDFVSAMYNDGVQPEDLPFESDNITNGLITVTKKSGSGAISSAGLGYLPTEEEEPDKQDPDAEVPDDQEPGKDEPPKSADDFIDLQGYEWAKASIDNLVKMGIITGTTNTTFEPARPINRAEFAKLIVSVFGFESKDKAVLFSDVNEGDWYFDSVYAASAVGVVTGYEDGRFLPLANITRQEMAAMVVRAFKAAEVKIASSGELTFADADQISVWAKEYVEILASIGIVVGRGDNLFAPTEYLTRAEAAKVINLTSLLYSIE